MTNEDLFATRALTIQRDWDENPRWRGAVRDHTAEDVVRLQGSTEQGQFYDKE
jgi:isocitrate lyase